MIENTDRWRRIEDLCDEALQRAPEDRAAFLREACGDDEIRRDVDVILANISRADAFLEQPVAAIAAQVIDAPPAPLLTGSTFRTFVIGPLIGAGGMGQVYRARDTALNRDVAVKVLPPEFARDVDRLERFACEARVLASLNHPNIAHIHGLESVDDVTAIVMELVDGETLADRIARGPVDVDETLQIARQIAEALEAAHEQGVIHRDLKPANIQIRSDGTVKVVDFGLATTRHYSIDTRADRGNASPLSTIGGMILGTAAYMAPEQVKGRPVDRRADVWALGCVVFEMLTARPTFVGDTTDDVRLKVLEHEPDWAALPANTPPAIHRLLHRCLEKSVIRRLDSAVVARLEIEDAVQEPSPLLPTGGSRLQPRRAWLALGWVSAAGSIAVLIMTALARPSPRPERRVDLLATSVLVERLPLAQPGIHFSVAPSGQTVVFAGSYRGSRVLFRRDLDHLDAEPIAGTAGASDPFFSGDGQRIGFETRSELWTMSLDGRSPALLVPNHALRGGTWNSGDQIVVGRVGSGLWTTSAESGQPRQLTTPAQGERHELPQLLPGGRTVLFTVLSVKRPARAALHRLDTGETRELFEGIAARFVDSGHIVFGREGKLWAIGFDPDSLQTDGAALPVRSDVVSSATGYPQFTVNGGLLAYVRMSEASRNVGKTVLALVNRKGEKAVLPLPPDNYMLARFSPNGDRIVVAVGATRELWTYELGRGTFTRLTSDRVVSYAAPTWTPDGKRVVFTTWFDGEVGLGSIPADGSGPVEPLVRGAGMRSFERTHPAMLPDGSGVILTGLAPGSSAEDLLLVPLSTGARLKTLLHEPGVERNPAIAPTGRFLAYNSDETGRPEVYVRPFPDVAARRWQISTDGGAFPVWTRGGTEILYQDTQGRVMGVTVRRHSLDEFDFSNPKPVFTIGQQILEGLDREFDVTRDGERFLSFINADVNGRESAELVLISNWVEELKRLVPVRPGRNR